MTVKLSWNTTTNMRASVMVDILRNAIEAVMEARETDPCSLHGTVPFGGRAGV